MYKCPFCGKEFIAPETKETRFIKELNITGMCPECYESTFNTPVTSEWGEQLGSCQCCDRPIYQKDLDAGKVCRCGESYLASLTPEPKTIEEWLQSFEKAVESCPELTEFAPGLVSSVKEDTTQKTVSNMLLTLRYESPFPEDKCPAGIDYVDSLLELYLMNGWD